jgi:hypothetical protein
MQVPVDYGGATVGGDSARGPTPAVRDPISPNRQTEKRPGTRPARSRPAWRFWLHYMNLAEVDCLAANAYTGVALQTDEPRQWRHYAARAEVHSLRARHSRGEGYVRSRVFDEIWLAKVRLAQRYPAEAASVGLHALRLAADSRSSLIVDWFFRFDRNLTERYTRRAETTDFHEQVREYIRRAAPSRTSELS